MRLWLSLMYQFDVFWKNTPVNKAPWKTAFLRIITLLPGKLPSPPKNYFINFCCCWHYFTVVTFSISKLFKFTSFRGVCRTPATSLMDFFVTLVNCFDQCHKNLHARCCVGHRFASEFKWWAFLNVFISMAHISAGSKQWKCVSCTVCIIQIICSERHNFQWVISSAYYHWV